MLFRLCFIVLFSGLMLGCATAHPQSKADSLYKPKPGTAEVDQRLVGDYLKEFRALSEQELSGVATEDDFNRRAAAARVRLERERIPVSSAGVDVVEERYLSGGDAKAQAYGFWLLGQLGLQAVANERIADVILRFVEQHPTDPVCDSALWALGETGTEEALEDFYRIAADTERYGPAARERSFCCISQCGRYSATTRYENIPRILKLARQIQEPETQKWCLMALGYMAPGVRGSSITAWEKWWQTQEKLRAATREIK